LSSNEEHGQVNVFHQNWPSDSWIGCLKHIDVASKCEAKFHLMVKLEVEFEDQINDENSLDFMLLNSTCFLCGSGLSMFYVRLKMMNGNIC
jgi:hypothetical protein